VPDSVFGSDQVMTISVQGLKEAQDRLTRAAQGVQPQGLARPMSLAVGMVHRYLLGLKRSGTPPTAQGILPVVSGRLANSFFFQVRRSGASITGLVASNVLYGAKVEERRRFLLKTVRDQERPVNDLLSAHIRTVTQ